MTTTTQTEVAVPAGATPDRRAPVAPGLGGRVASALRRYLLAGAWGLVGLAATLGLWQAFGQIDGIPTPAEGLDTFAGMVSDPFYDNGPNDKGVGIQLGVSLQRVFAGFALAALAGIPAGLLLGASKRAWLAFNPVVQVLRPVSPLAWFPIWLVIFQSPPQASVFVIFITSLWPTLVNTAAGAANIPHDQRSVARVFRFGRFAYVRHVLLPNALPQIITGMRLSMGIAWMVIVAVEMLSGNSGIGFFVWDSYNAGRIDLVIAAIILIGVIGFVLDAVLLKISRKVAIEEVKS